MGGVNERGRCHRCERWIEGGLAVFTPEEWTDITLDANLDCYLDSARDDLTGGQT